VTLGYPKRSYPRKETIYPFLMNSSRVLGPDEILHLHLLELARPENEITGSYLVAKRFADLSDPEWQLATRGVQYVCKVNEDTLRGLRSKIRYRRWVVVCRDRSNRGFEHQVEVASFGEAALRILTRM